MTSRIVLEDDGYEPQTELSIRHMTSSWTDTPDDGAVEAMYFLERFPDLRPVGPFRDPRNSRINRFRLESSDRTGISYVVGHNINLEEINAIKEAYQQRRTERQSRKRKHRAKRDSSKRMSGFDPSAANQHGEAAFTSRTAASATVARQVSGISTGIDGHDSICSPATNREAIGLKNEKRQQPLSHPVRCLYPETQQRQVIFPRPHIEKMMAEHGLTAEQKDWFLEYEKEKAAVMLPSGYDQEAELDFLLTCRIDLIYLASGEAKSDRAKEIESLHAEVKSMKEEQTTRSLNEEREAARFKKLEDAVTSLQDNVTSLQDNVTKISNGILALTNIISNILSNSSRGEDIVSKYNDVLDHANMVRDLCGMRRLSSLRELGRAEEQERLETIECLKKLGYTVQSPGEVIEELRKDAIEERKQRQELEARVLDLETRIHQAEKFDIILTIVLLFVLMILALQHFLRSRNGSSNTKGGFNGSGNRDA